MKVSERKVSEMKEPVEVVHRMAGAALDVVGTVVTAEGTDTVRGGCTTERLVGERESLRAMVPPPE